MEMHGFTTRCEATISSARERIYILTTAVQLLFIKYIVMEVESLYQGESNPLITHAYNIQTPSFLGITRHKCTAKFADNTQ